MHAINIAVINSMANNEAFFSNLLQKILWVSLAREFNGRLILSHEPSSTGLMIQSDGNEPIIELKAVKSLYKNDLYYNAPIDGTDRGDYTLLNTTYGRHCTITNRSVGFDFNDYEMTIKLLDWEIDKSSVNKSIAYTSNRMIDEYSSVKIRFQLTIIE